MDLGVSLTDRKRNERFRGKIKKKVEKNTK